MTRRVAIRVGGWDNLLLISLVLAVLAWLIEAALAAFVFGLGPLPERLLPLNDLNELWMRVEAIGTFLILSVYCHVIIAQRKRVEDELPHIVRPFYRAATARDVPGAGLGLASAKTIVEQHGGQIRVASALGVVLPPSGHRAAPRQAPGAGTQEETDRRGRREESDQWATATRTPGGSSAGIPTPLPEAQ